MIGASLLWVGWFGFNAGSALEANNSAALAFINTFLATACARAVLDASPSGCSRASRRCWAPLRAPSPASSRSRPAAGNVGIHGRLRRSASSRAWSACGASTGSKRMLGADDSLDVFGVHARRRHPGRAAHRRVHDARRSAAPASWPTGSPARWSAPATTRSLARCGSRRRRWASTIVWSGVVAFIAYKIVDLVVGLRVPEEEEREGLDITAHGESAYRMIVHGTPPSRGGGAFREVWVRPPRGTAARPFLLDGGPRRAWQLASAFRLRTGAAAFDAADG